MSVRTVLAILLLAGVGSPALAQRDDQREAYRAMREGRIRSLGDILSRIPQSRRQAFIGSEFAPGDRYRLKFMDRGAVSSVDVDARTGQVLGDPRGRGDDEGRRGYIERRMYDDRPPPRRFEDRGYEPRRRRERF